MLLVASVVRLIFLVLVVKQRHPGNELLLAMTCNLLRAQENSGVKGAIGFAFASYWNEKRARHF